MEKDIIQKDLAKTGLNSQTGEEFVIPQDDPEWIKAKQTKQDGTIEITTPSGKKLELSRKEITAHELGAIMQSKELSRDEKNYALMQYQMSEGQENSVFLAELYQSKGRFTKEARQFSAMMRFDFESFIGNFLTFLRDTSASIVKEYHLENDWKEFMEKLVTNKANMQDTMQEMNMLGAYSRAETSMILLAAQFESEADVLKKGVDKITQAREREAGMGVYISKTGQVYDLNDISLVDIVRKEIEEETKGRIKHNNEQ